MCLSPFLDSMSKSKKKLIKDHYDEVSTEFIKRYEGARGLYYELLEEQYVLDLLPEDVGKVLDVGTGDGRFLRAIIENKNCCSAVGIELSSNMADIADEKTQQKVARFAQMDGECLGMKSSSVDTVLLIGTLEYMADITNLLDEVYRVIRPNGVVVFTFSNKNNIIPNLPFTGGEYSTPDHSIDEIDSQLRESGFEFVSYRGTFYCNNYVWPIYNMLRGIGLQSVSRRFLLLMAKVQQLFSKSKWAERRSGVIIVLAEPKN